MMWMINEMLNFGTRRNAVLREGLGELFSCTVVNVVTTLVHVLLKGVKRAQRERLVRCETCHNVGQLGVVVQDDIDEVVDLTNVANELSTDFVGLAIIADLSTISKSFLRIPADGSSLPLDRAAARAGGLGSRSLGSN